MTRHNLKSREGETIFDKMFMVNSRKRSHKILGRLDLPQEADFKTERADAYYVFPVGMLIIAIL
jgi:hypothetical protein